MAKKRQEKRLDMYLDFIEKSEQFRDSSYRDDWDRYYKRWRNYVSDRGGKLDDPRASNMSIPYIFTQVETIVPRIVNSMFPSRPFVSIHPRVPMFNDNAKQHQVLLDYQMNDVLDMKSVFQDVARCAVLFGYGVVYTGWQRQKKLYVTDREQPLLTDEGYPVFEEDGTPATVSERGVIEDTFLDDPYVQAIDPGLFFYDPGASCIDDARFCGHISYVSEDELKKMQKLGVYKINWDNVNADEGKNEVRDRRLGEIGKTGVDASIMEEENDIHEIIHYWEDDRYVVILDRVQVIRETENPFWHKKKPYDIAPYTRVPFEIGGIGVVEMLEDLQDELNAERNMRMEYRKFVVRPMLKMRKTAGLTSRDLRISPGKVFMVDELEDLTQMNISDIDSSTFVQENTIKQDMKDTTGAHDIIMGLHTPGEESATTTVTKDNNAGARFKLIIENMSSAFERVAMKMVSMNQQFLDDPRFVREYGAPENEWTTINPRDLSGEFTLSVVASADASMNSEAQKQRLIQLYSILNNDPLFNMNPVKKRNFLKKIAESFGIRDTEEILPNDQEIQAMQQPQAPPGMPAGPTGPPGAPSIEQFETPVPNMSEVVAEEEESF